MKTLIIFSVNLLLLSFPIEAGFTLPLLSKISSTFNVSTTATTATLAPRDTNIADIDTDTPSMYTNYLLIGTLD